MRKSLEALINKTFIFEYSLPNNEKKINSICISNDNDKCYSINNINNLIEIIYNSILEYAFDEFDLTENSYLNLLSEALLTKIRYYETDTQATKLKYGFYGEVLLHCALNVLFSTNTFLSRGHLFNPLEKSETKGYDAYHLVENNKLLQLWLGEVKFYVNYKSAINSIMNNVNKALSDDYLKLNLLAISKYTKNFNESGTRIRQILDNWKNQSYIINIVEELEKYNAELVYPILLVYEGDNQEYDNNIKKVIEYFEEKSFKLNATLSIPYKLYFILLPINEVKKVKLETLEWIKLKKPVLL